MNPSKRRKGRRYAVQGLYQWQLTDNPPAEIFERMLDDVNMNKTDIVYMEELIIRVPEHLEDIDNSLSAKLSRKLTEVDPVERAILRIGVYELLKRPDIPYRVVINEAVVQAKTFGAEDGHKFVNGVLDKVASVVRAVEVQDRKKGQT